MNDKKCMNCVQFRKCRLICDPNTCKSYAENYSLAVERICKEELEAEKQ